MRPEPSQWGLYFQGQYPINHFLSYPIYRQHLKIHRTLQIQIPCHEALIYSIYLLVGSHADDLNTNITTTVF